MNQHTTARPLSPEFDPGADGQGEKLLEGLLSFLARRNAKDPFLVEARIERSRFLRSPCNEAALLREVLRKIAQPNQEVVEEVERMSRLVVSGAITDADVVEQHIAASRFLQQHMRAHTRHTEAEALVRLLHDFQAFASKRALAQEREIAVWQRKAEDAEKLCADLQQKNQAAELLELSRVQGARIADLEALLEKSTQVGRACCTWRTFAFVARKQADKLSLTRRAVAVSVSVAGWFEQRRTHSRSLA